MTLMQAARRSGFTWRRWYSCQAGTGAGAASAPSPVSAPLAADSCANTPARILAHMHRDLHRQRGHPLGMVNSAAQTYFRSHYPDVFCVQDRLSPLVSVEQNFDSLLVPAGHPSRRRSDGYYLSHDRLLRAHTTAHMTDLLRQGLHAYLVVGDVYRRDAIDRTHYPVFHQLDALRSQTRDQLFPDRPDVQIFERYSRREALNREGVRRAAEDVALPEPLPESAQPCHTPEATKVMEYQLKHVLIGLVKHLFGENIDYRWVDAHFPFTRPSWELEIFFNGDWMEVLGCGIVRDEILRSAGKTDSIAYAFGLGLERIAMALYDIPDIRLFWSRDSGFLSQFASAEPGRILKYRPVSAYPQCKSDLAFWLPDGISKADFSENDFYDLARDIGGDIVEQVELFDAFSHPKTKRTSLCFRIVYRHMERTLVKGEVNDIHRKIEKAAEDILKVTVR